MVAWLDNVLGVNFFFLKFKKKKSVIKKSGNCLLNRGWETNCKRIIEGKKNGSGNVGWPDKGIEGENQDMDLDGY